MTARMLEALLYHHRATRPRNTEAVHQLLADGLLRPDVTAGMLVTTEKGAAHIKQLCALELPTAVWVNKAGELIE